MVSPRCSGRVMSSFAVWVIDQVSPWLTPSRTVAATIQFQLGPHSSISGIGSAASQPNNSTRLRPMRSESRPATKFITPFTKPNATTKAVSNTKELRASPNSLSARVGTTVRIMPMVKPTSSTCSI